MLIYNLFPLLCGKFPTWNKHIDRAEELGFDCLYINPVHKTGASKSLYSISSYYQFDSRFVEATGYEFSHEQLKAIIEYAHKRNLKVIVDLVINHCAVDSNLLTGHPDWFKYDNNGKVINPGCDDNGHRVTWYDLAQFDHNNPQLLGYFYRLCGWLISLGVDGFRCDAAYMVPPEFWKKLIGDIKAIKPNVKFIAEALGCDIGQLDATVLSGFDMAFNSSKWWDYKSQWLMAANEHTRQMCESISFPESHDTQRLTEEVNGNIEAVKLRYLFSALFSTGVMMPQGFEFGMKKRLSVVNTNTDDWQPTGIDLSSFICDVNSLKKQHEVFQHDTQTRLIEGIYDWNITVMHKNYPNSSEQAIIIMNTNWDNSYNVNVNKLCQFFPNSRQIIVHSYGTNKIDNSTYIMKPCSAIVLVAIS
jgi:starch synthase (maltosyl-transferring)